MNRRDYWNQIIKEFGEKTQYVTAAYCYKCPLKNISQYYLYDNDLDIEHNFRWFFNTVWTGDCDFCKSRNKWWVKQEELKSKVWKKAQEETQFSLFEINPEVIAYEQHLEWKKNHSIEQEKLLEQWNEEREWREKFKDLSWKYNEEFPFTGSNYCEEEEEEEEELTQEELEEIE